MMATQLQISGMICGHYVQGVTKSLQNVAGVQRAVVDLASGQALFSTLKTPTPTPCSLRSLGFVETPGEAHP